MKGLLAKARFPIVESAEAADVIILNICTVKGTSNALTAVRKTAETFPSKKIIVAGCVPPELLKPIRDLAPESSIVNTHNVAQIVQVVEETINDNPVTVMARSGGQKFGLPRIRKSPIIGILPISSGCDSICTFCSTRLVKGVHKSYPVEALEAEVKSMVAEGCKEVWITGQDTGCYGLDIDTTLPELLKKLCAVPGDFRIRLGMANPKHMKKYVEDLIALYQLPKMFRFIHIPVQSGNNDVLRAMKRDYTVEDYQRIVDELRSAMPDITVSTDIIVGFPGETEEQFHDTLRLVKETQPDVLNISRFAARQGTVAKQMDNQVLGGVAKQRAITLGEVFAWTAFERNKRWVGWEGDVLIDEQKDNTWTGRNYAYRPIIMQGSLAIGQVVKAKVHHVTKFDLRARTSGQVVQPQGEEVALVI